MIRKVSKNDLDECVKVIRSSFQTVADDTGKEEIAFAQSYFAVQTRKQELIEERMKYIERTQARGRLKESEKRLSQNCIR